MADNKFFEVTEINDGALLRFEKHGEDGQLLASFQIDPYDPEIMTKIKNVLKECKEMDFQSVDTWLKLVQMEHRLEDLTTEALGSVSGSMFRHYLAMQRLDNGKFYLYTAFEEIGDAVLDRVLSRHRSIGARLLNLAK